MNAFQYTTEALLWSTTVALPGLPDLYYAACSGLPGLCTRNNLLLIVPFLADFQSSTDALLHAKVLSGDLHYFLARVGALHPPLDDQHQIVP